MFQRITGLDIPQLLSGIAPAWVIKTACAILGVSIAVALRAIADRVAPGVAPYAFIYPASLLTTLLAGWQSGAGTMLAAGALAWIYIVPQAVQSGGQMNHQGTAAVIAGLTGAMVIAAGEGFRAAARKAAEERSAKLAERELLFRELQHRVGNDFAIVNSLLDLQRRRSSDQETRGALEQAMGRIQSISRVHRHIYALPDTSMVDLRQYLRDLCAGLTEATLPPAGIELHCECDGTHMERDRALAIGLVTNELITNAVKHAFAGRREGRIDASFARTAEGWRLTVKDDGIGMPEAPPRTGLGTGLIEQFVRQAGGVLTMDGSHGTTARLDLSASAATPAA